MSYRLIQVGTGGFGRKWCLEILPHFVATKQIEVVAAVDTSPEALQNARLGLGLGEHQCFSNLEEALSAPPADICAVVVPPSAHEEVVDAALERGMHILSEKPIADTLEGSLRIARKVEAADRKMAITMSHRFDQDKTTLRSQVRDASNGRLDYLVGRFTSANRELNSWGAFRHSMSDPMLVEGAIHHLDILIDLAGSTVRTVFAQTWNPPWGQYAGDSEGVVFLHFTNGVKAVYEGATSTAVGLNSWSDEYFRAECEKATLVLDRRNITRYSLDRAAEVGPWVAPPGDPVPLVEGSSWKHLRVIDRFLEWLDGGRPSETSVAENLHSTMVMFAAVESSRRGEVVDVAEFVRETMAAM